MTFQVGQVNVKRKEKREKKEKVNYATAFLPLGIPQYAHSKPVLGTLFAASQAGGVGLWYYFKNQPTMQSLPQMQKRKRKFKRLKQPLAPTKSNYSLN